MRPACLWCCLQTQVKGQRRSRHCCGLKLPSAVPVPVPVPVSSTLARITQLVRGFSATWKQSVEAMSRDVMRSFTNFKNGTSIIQVRLSPGVSWAVIGADGGGHSLLQMWGCCQLWLGADGARKAFIQKIWKRERKGSSSEGFFMLVL